MASKKKTGRKSSSSRSGADAENMGQSRAPEREGQHGTRLNEEQIDVDIANKTMEGGSDVDQNEAREAFEKDKPTEH